MISVAIVGSGNVATNLIEAFFRVENISIDVIYSRNILDIQKWKEQTLITDKITDIKDVDVTIIALSDIAIGEVSKQLSTKFVVHTSGSVSMNHLSNSSRKGIFYPLQTFTKDKLTDFKEVPFCLEAENHTDLKLLEKLAESLGSKYYHINSQQRKKLHVAAVFANNFTNHLYGLSKNFCEQNDVPFEVLHPIIKSAAIKATENHPFKIQTGPAMRNDKITIENHLHLLSENEKIIYKLLTESIQNHGKKL